MNTPNPNFVSAEQFARLFGSTPEQILAACAELGIDTESGVPKTDHERIRGQLRRWILEGR